MTATPTRRQAAAALTRERVLAAARQLFLTSAYEDVKAGDIAKAAGVAHGLVFHHFGNKQGLYQEVLCQIGREVLALHVHDPELPLGRRIRQSHAAHLAYLAEHPDIAQILLLRTPDRDEARFEDVREQGNRNLADNLGLDYDRPAVRLALRLYATAADQLARDFLTGSPFDAATVVEVLMTVLAGVLRAARTADPGLDIDKILELLAVP
ncbi:AcrR family transcriptional regulator [Crossiella equi]|uniref:AcrR family transcriptional regulator n=1 Tax=Crossiella equi TaxID=130796 RepID=A0ABS5AFM5_9PSEU|nr:TetR family transcriptional regulator [Crossiella equi]MBP2475137.1 AcrR family transcriptional regulator [Crossiella equi]